MKELIKNKRLQIAFTVAGALGGFLYWKLIGCTIGTCPIKSVWYWSTLWGAAVGFLVGDFIYDFLKKREKKKEVENERKISEHN
jgi:hypothetical protein